MTAVTTVACPTCGTPVEWGEQSPARPFCSERCKLIDLGAWAAEEHAIPGEPDMDAMFADEFNS
ncbi:MAG: DNA gyrase inhibitor YacG [Gammaproteobacteria bacterium]|nr:DNA gyrase inhibitor YacG [Gammaproteobacteria bacterium]